MPGVILSQEEFERNLNELVKPSIIAEFTSSFTGVEMVLQLLIRELSGMGKTKANIICAGMRNTDLIKRLKRLLKLPEYDTNEWRGVLSAIGKFEEIAKLRSYIFHRYSEIDGEILRSMDFTELERIVEIPLEALKKAVKDLRYIYSLILFRAYPEYHSKPVDDPLFAPYSWQYTPLPQLNPQ